MLETVKTHQTVKNPITHVIEEVLYKRLSSLLDFTTFSNIIILVIKALATINRSKVST